MDVQQIITQLTNHWTTLMDQYYDNVSNEYLQTISEKYNIPINDLKNETSGLKDIIMKKITNCMDPPNQETEQKNEPEKKEKKTKSKKDTSLLENMSRKQLQEICKEKGIPTKRKNADMIEAINEFNKVNLEKDPEVEIKVETEEEPEVEIKVETEEEPEVEIKVETEEEPELTNNISDEDDYLQTNNSDEEYNEMQEEDFTDDEDD